MIRDAISGWRAAFRRICSPDAARVILAICIVAGCVVLAHVFGLTLCPMKRLLGVSCPTCGTTRAVVLLLRGDVCGAFAMQPLAMAVMTLLMPVSFVAWLAGGGPRLKRMFAVLTRKVLFWSFVVLVVLANWMYVIVHGN